MARVGLGLALLLMMAVCGCEDLVVSLQPLATEDTVITDPRLVGKWLCEDQIWEFTPSDSKAYRLRVVELLTSSTFRASLVEVGGHRFLDIVPDDVTQGHPMGLVYAMHLVPGHGLFKVQLGDSRLAVENLSRKGFQEMAAKDPNLLPHDEVDGRVVLTCPTEELQPFVLKYADANGLWEEMLDFAKARPLYTRDQVVADPNLAGRWTDPNVVLDISRPGDDRLYQINGWIEGQLPIAVWAYLVQRDGVQFWACFLDKPSPSAKTPQADLVPDMVIRVEQLGSQMQLSPVEPKQVARLMAGDQSEFSFDCSDTVILARQIQ